MKGEPGHQEKRYHGVPAAPGIARGPIHVFSIETDDVVRYHVDPASVPDEIARFENALIQTRAQILEMQQQIAEAIGAKDAGIFDAHLLVVEDQTLIDEVLRKLEADHCNVEFTFQEVANRYVDSLSKIDDPYLRERAIDIQDVTRRVIRNLQGRSPRPFLSIDQPHILVAHNLTPSDTATMNREQVRGLVLDLGSRTSHTAIMAQSLGIPSVVGLHDATETLETGAPALIDGYHGLLIINPSEETLRKYEEIERQKGAIAESLTQLRETKSTTRDGRHIVLSANIELPDEVDAVLRHGAEGVGLYRTEFLYLNETTLPTEEEQFEVYLTVAERLAPDPLIIRTLDLGGDKVSDGIERGDELNPFLGWRAIRFCLENIDIFKAQLRAILRASVSPNVKMMFPMISGLEEVRRALEIVDECKNELRKEGQPFNDELDIGVMIEVPTAAIMADRLAREVDFFSIGTNDLIQYAVAIDRTNERVAHLYEPSHPSVVRLLKMVADAAHANGIWVGICGEMAGDVLFTPLLLGLGMDELSAGPTLVPQVKSAVQRLTITECERLVVEVLQLDTSAAILARCAEMAEKNYPELLG
ncbi:MAG: phosphoenolpyruvate--protein phosphotransferase [Verrucomicrobiota bacterium]|nr:phosphoenolpyruvate--protein phosphotransferase [Chthoniobacterales bacterium]MDQ3546785.1 phosphoenolpyruvate--protein phosphotransferase [Verrucomicrobiota bacterium]